MANEKRRAALLAAPKPVIARAGYWGKIGQTVEVPLSDLHVSVYVREKPDQDHTLMLAELIDGGVELDPITVYPNEDGSGCIVRDGRHRVDAGALLDRKTVRAKVVPPARDTVQEIALAFKANAGGPKPPTRDDIEHSIRLLLAEKVPYGKIAEILPIPQSLAKKYIRTIQMQRLRARLKQAMEAITDGSLNIPQAAARYDVDEEQLRKEMGGRRKKKHQKGAEAQRVIRARFRSLSQHNGAMLRKLLEGYQDGDVSMQLVETALRTMRDSLRQIGSTLKSWEQRFHVARGTQVQMAEVESDGDDNE